jgi:hypothetical protein
MPRPGRAKPRGASLRCPGHPRSSSCPAPCRASTSSAQLRKAELCQIGRHSRGWRREVGTLRAIGFYDPAAFLKSKAMSAGPAAGQARLRGARAPVRSGIAPLRLRWSAQEVCMHECELISWRSDLNMQKCTVRCTTRHFLSIRLGKDVSHPRRKRRLVFREGRSRHAQCTRQTEQQRASARG